MIKPLIYVKGLYHTYQAETPLAKEALLGVEEPWFLVGIISLGVASGQLRERPPRKPPEEVCTFVG